MRAALGLAALTALSAVGTAAAQVRSIGDKTLVVWAAPADLEQRGGSALTLEKAGGVFDAVVFGELAPARWMAGSDMWSRTSRAQDDVPPETAAGGALVQVAIAYAGERVTITREGRVLADYPAGGSQRFRTEDVVLMGLRHTDAAPGGRWFRGAIADARVYDVALTPAQIAALRLDAPSDPPPLAWWDFERGSATDRMGAFPVTTLVGGARVEDGCLWLDAEGAYLMASAEPSEPSVLRDADDANRAARALREHLLRDPYRPGYHFVTPEGTCMPFDPNGAIFWRGRYHLFYIFQDERGHDWGHVSSTDLFHWRHHPTGLVGGMFSGNCFLDEEGRPTVCYHQVGQGNALAVALDDELDAWEKLPTNPITPHTEPGDPHHGAYRSWDPFGWREDGSYYAIFGGERPAVAKSEQLGGPWRFVGDLFANGVAGVALDEDVSCADFFELGGRRVLVCISHRLGCRYYVGDWRDEQFHPTFHARMSWADHSFFAPETLLDDQGRRILWAWVLDGPGFGLRTDHGWSGTLSLPRVLTLGEDGALRMEPPREVEGLRYDARDLGALSLAADGAVQLAGVEGRSLELAVTFQPGAAEQVGVEVCRSPDEQERTVVFYDAREGRLGIDTTASSLADGPRGVEAGPLALAPGEPLALRVFVDHSIVEVFANGRQAVVRRIYPSRADSLGVALFARGGSATATSVAAWSLMPSNPY